jgi:osmoprotectant transport system substrate-binding protein
MKFLPLVCVIVTVFLVIAGCIGTAPPRDKTVVIGVMPFNEQYILGEMISLLLEEKGYNTKIASGMNNAALYEAVKTGQVDVYVDYTSSIYYQLPDPQPVDRWNPDEVYAIVDEGLAKDGIDLLGRVGFRNDNIIVVPSSWAGARNITTVSSLSPYAEEMVFGSDLVFHAAEEDGLPHLEEVYEFKFKDVKPMDPALTFPALQSGKVDAIVAYSTDSRIELFNLTPLEDDLFALPPYHAIILVNNARAEDPEFVAALSPLIDAIDADAMRAMNIQFDVDKRDPQDIARDYLREARSAKP